MSSPGTAEQYDPAADPDARLYELPEAKLYIARPGTLLQDIYDDKTSETSLGSFAYPGLLASSALRLSQDGLAENDRRWRYNGKITLRDSDGFSRAKFMDAYLERLKDVPGTEAEPFYYDNCRLIVAKASGALAVLSVYEKDGEINYQNHVSLSSKSRRVALELRAPTLKEIDMRPEGQFVDHVRNYIVAVNTAADVMGERPAITKYAITPGKVYSWGYTGTKKTVDNAASSVDEAGAPSGERALLSLRFSGETTVKLEDIAGNDDLKATLKRVAVSFKHPDVLAKWGAVRPQGILLYGPAGTGKSTMAQALANEVEGDLWEIRSSEIYDRYLGESEKNLQAIFDKAKDITKPTVMVWNELDGLIRGGDGERDNHAVQRLAGLFKTEMEKARQNANLIIMATTNHYESIDPALIRDGRFDVKHYVPLPDAATRTTLFVNTIAAMTTRLGSETFVPFSDDLDPEALAAAAVDMSGATITNVFQQVAFEKAMLEASGTAPAPITQHDLLTAIRNRRLS